MNYRYFNSKSCYVQVNECFIPFIATRQQDSAIIYRGYSLFDASRTCQHYKNCTDHEYTIWMHDRGCRYMRAAWSAQT